MSRSGGRQLRRLSERETPAASIGRESVDFISCNETTGAPFPENIVALELDDRPSRLGLLLKGELVHHL